MPPNAGTRKSSHGATGPRARGRASPSRGSGARPRGAHSHPRAGGRGNGPRAEGRAAGSGLREARYATQRGQEASIAQSNRATVVQAARRHRALEARYATQPGHPEGIARRNRAVARAGCASTPGEVAARPRFWIRRPCKTVRPPPPAKCRGCGGLPRGAHPTRTPTDPPRSPCADLHQRLRCLPVLRQWPPSLPFIASSASSLWREPPGSTSRVLRLPSVVPMGTGCQCESRSWSLSRSPHIPLFFPRRSLPEHNP